MLRFHMNEFRFQTAVLDHFRKPFDNDRLRGDRIGRDHIRLCKTDALGKCLIAG